MATSIHGNMTPHPRHFHVFFDEGREGVKWELGLAYFRLGKWDWGYWDWDLATGNGE